MNPYKLSHLFTDDKQWAKVVPENVISRVKKPLNWAYGLQLKKLTLEECVINMNSPKGLWTQSIWNFNQLSPFLYCAEECLHAYWENSLIYDFNLKIHKAELNIEQLVSCPVLCKFSMDKDDKLLIEQVLREKGQLLQVGMNVHFFAQNIEIGQIYFELDIHLKRTLVSRH
ncbi:MAG: hypothetical protein KDD40_02095 [Bdellovibrionales bacterium]|nr:hypothetical protein [Bdellovibrionales bacterium]